eukprot:GHRQ01011876.1.p1 GENE.GHRQ01011876.1~~GHRQ01011876.1.p1  ORF type:complete len:130 (+),score=35.99 GHRQ01011876.1:333-722(+)
MPKPPGNRKKLKSGSVKSSTAKPKARGSSKGTARQSLSAGQLFERGQQALAFERYDAALECMRDALQLEPENTEFLDAHGALLAELGRVQEAVQVRELTVHAGRTCSPSLSYRSTCAACLSLQWPDRER